MKLQSDYEKLKELYSQSVTESTKLKEELLSIETAQFSSENHQKPVIDPEIYYELERRYVRINS